MSVGGLRCIHERVVPVLTEGGPQMRNEEQLVYQCELCLGHLLQCQHCKIFHTKRFHCRKCEVPECTTAHYRDSPYCSTTCAAKGAAAKRAGNAKMKHGVGEKKE